VPAQGGPQRAIDSNVYHNNLSIKEFHMLKKEMDMIDRINKLLIALVEGNLRSTRLPKDLGEFEKSFSLLLN